ncbi:VOC family protein [Psychromarinibacter sp. C21-152]|uniref:VOC family protein n=1 Tax=Psychromarinibacter sediminicola TaxID=3033385 RepID=A0AAE3TBY5_9RHOB|nr:VOC family protein [Psychromarinibacter sediminicola]MDF0603399.1 VOC family protein [Psychromarinibacter sediminicola]
MPYTPQFPVVWTEIPVGDFDKAVAFYRAAMDYDLTVDNSGPNPMAMIPGTDDMACSGHIYPGTPGKGAGPTIHLSVPGTVEEAVEKWVAAGGTKVSDAIAIPPGRFAYVEDPDGNSIGLFEPAKG